MSTRSATSRAPHGAVSSSPCQSLSQCGGRPRLRDAGRAARQDLAYALGHASDLVEDVTLFDVYRGANLTPATRSLAYSVRFSSHERTLRDEEVSGAREALIDCARDLGATLR